MLCSTSCPAPASLVRAKHRLMLPPPSRLLQRRLGIVVLAAALTALGIVRLQEGTRTPAASDGDNSLLPPKPPKSLLPAPPPPDAPCEGFLATESEGRLGNQLNEYATLYAHSRRLGEEQCSVVQCSVTRLGKTV